MTSRLATVTPTTRVSRALERMAVLGCGKAPSGRRGRPRLVSGHVPARGRGAAYHEALTTTTDVELHRARLAQRTSAGAGYYDFKVPPRSIADGRAIREVSWPEGSTLVSIRRERNVMVPSGDTVLLNGDLITAFGTPTSKERMIDRLNAGAEEVTEVSLGTLRRWNQAPAAKTRTTMGNPEVVASTRPRDVRRLARSLAPINQ